MIQLRVRRLWQLPGLLCMSLLLPTLGTAQSADSPARQHFTAAQQDQQRGDLDAAVREYQAFIRLQPDIPEAYVNLGLVYYAEAKFAESDRALSTANKLRPGMRGVSLWLGIDELKLHRAERGVTLLREAVREAPSDKSAQSWLGNALWDAGRTDEALLQLTHATRLFPDDPDLLFARGEAYGKAASQQTNQLLEDARGTALSDLIYGTTYAGEHEWVKAEAHLRRAIERDPRLTDARLELAQVFLQQAELPDAEAQLDQALVIDPKSAAALALSGELLLLLQQQHEGFSRLDRALDDDRSAVLDALGLPPDEQISDPETGPALLTLCRKAIQELETGQTQDRSMSVALASLYVLEANNDAVQKTLESRTAPAQPLNATADRYIEAIRAMHEHRYDDAESLLLHWLQAHPGDLAARYRLIQVRRHISAGEITRLIAVAPDSFHIHQLLGQLYVSLTMANESTDGAKEDDKAIAEYRAVVAAKPDLAGAHFWLGHLYWKHGNTDQAFAELTRELQLDPEDAAAHAELGAVLVTQGKDAEAIPHLETAIRIMPELWPAYLDLGRAFAGEENYARAEQLLEHVVAHDRDGTAHYQLGLVLRSEGKTAPAAQAFAQAQAIKKEVMATASARHDAAESAKGEAKQ
jgi:tetratricopeptide (TPR) repeat protein